MKGTSVKPSSKRDFSQYPSRLTTPSLSVRFEADLLEDIRKEAEAKGISAGELVRYYVELGRKHESSSSLL